MIHSMLIVWAALASLVILVAGLVLAFWSFGQLGPGLLLAAAAAGLLVACVDLAREEWGWRRRTRAARRTTTTRRVIPAHATPAAARSVARGQAGLGSGPACSSGGL